MIAKGFFQLSKVNVSFWIKDKEILKLISSCHLQVYHDHV